MTPIRLKITLDTSELKSAEAEGKRVADSFAKGVSSGIQAERQASNQLTEGIRQRVEQYRRMADVIRQKDVYFKQLANSLNLTNRQMNQLTAQINAQNRAYQQAQQAQQRYFQQQQRLTQQQARASGRAAISPGTAIYNQGGVGNQILGAAIGGIGGGGFLPSLGGIAAGSLGASVPVIGAIVAGLTLINKLIETGASLVRKWVEVWYEYRVTIERAKLGLTVLLGSQEMASGYVQQLIKDLRGLGDLDSALVLSRRLLNVGLAADEARQKVRELVTIAAGLGSTATEQKGLAKALSDTVTAGRLRGQEVLQFNNAGINIQGVVARSLGITQNEVRKLQEDGKVSARQVLDAISKEAKRYEPILEQALLLPDVSINRIKQQMGRLGDKIFGALFDGVARKLKELADFLEKTDSIEAALLVLAEKFAVIGGDLAGQLIGGFIGYFSNPDNIAKLVAAAIFIQQKFQEALGVGIVKGIVQGFLGTTFGGKQKTDTNYPKGGAIDNPPTDDDRSSRKSFGERLQNRLTDLRQEINAFSNLSSSNFKAKFEIEGLERLKRDYETILNLRFELGLKLNEPLPKDAQAVRALREDLESQKRIFDGVKQAREEGKRAAEDLAIAIRTSLLPVVDAETRVQIAYNRLIRERRNEEAQLTADITLEAQKRIDAINDEAEASRKLRIARGQAELGILSEANSASAAAAIASERRRITESGGLVYGLDKASDNGGVFSIGTQAVELADARRGAIRDRVAATYDDSISDLIDEIDRLTFTEQKYNDVAERGKRMNLQLTKALTEAQRDLREQVEAAAINAVTLNRQLDELNDSTSARARLTVLEGENDVIRAQIALREKSLRDESETRIRRIEAQDELSRKMVFDADKVKAAVEENAASAKGINDIIADAFIRTSDTISSGIDAVLNKATQGLGAFGSILSGVASQLLKLVTNQLVMRLMNLMLGGSGQEAATAARGSVFGGFGLPAIFGGGIGAGGGGFLTPGINPAASLPSILNLFGGGNTATGIFANGQFAAGLANGAQRATGIFANGQFAAGLRRGAGVSPPVLGLGATLKAAAPLLGLTAGFGIGSSLGGMSKAGNILGGAGGLLAGGALTGLLIGKTALAAGLGGGAFGAGAAAFLTNPITAVAGAALLVGGIFLGKAKQRREDEKLADSHWVQYMNTLDQLTRDVRANRLSGDDALAQAAVARQQAIDQISTIKTDSVRKSRLRNQIPDVDRLKLEPLKRAVEEQKRRKEFDSFLIPEFATGGRVPGRPSEKRLVMAHGEELIINSRQQTPELLMAAARAGVPGVKGSNNARSSSSQPTVNITFVIGTEDQSQMFINGLQNNRATKSLRDTINSLVAHGEI